MDTPEILGVPLLFGRPPRIRFDASGVEGQSSQCEPAVLFGVGEWVGLILEGTRRVHIVLAGGYAATDFNLASCEVLSLREVITFAWEQSAGKVLLAAGLSVGGLRGDANGIPSHFSLLG